MADDKKKVKKHSPNDYKLLARKFKSAGLVKIDLRKKEISAYTKRKLRTLEKDSHKMAIANFFYTKKEKKREYQDLIIAKKTGTKADIKKAEKEFFRGHVHGLTEFKVRTVKNKNKLKDFKNAGYLVVGNKVYIKTEYGRDAHIKKFKSPLTGNYVTVIESTFRGNKTVRYVEPNIILMRELEAMKDNPLPIGTDVMVAVGENNPIGASQKTNYKDLMKYLENWKPNDSDSNKEKLINQMSIVFMDYETMGITKH